MAPLQVLERVEHGDFPASLYLEGPDEAVKAAFLAGFRRAWAASGDIAENSFGVPPSRVMRPDENSVEEILAAYQTASLFSPRELTVVLEVEDLGRSDKRVDAMATGLATPAGGSCIVLVESASDSVRKALEPLRAACSVRADAQPPGDRELLEWGKRRLASLGCVAEPGTLEALLETCEHDALALLDETGKLALLAGDGGRVTTAHVQALTAPRVGAELPDLLLAVASGDAPQAALKLERVLAAGEDEGSVMWALGHLVTSTLSMATNPYGWAKWKAASQALARRRRPPELARALDAVYRAEAAWKGGRVDARSALEQATRDVCAG